MIFFKLAKAFFVSLHNTHLLFLVLLNHFKVSLELLWFFVCNMYGVQLRANFK